MMAKVRKRQTDHIREKLKSKDKSEKSKAIRVKPKKTGLEKVEHHPDAPAPNSHVQGSEFDGEATIKKSAEQSQMVRELKHRSATKSQPSKVLHSSLVKIAEYVQLAHEATGRTASTV